MKTVKYLTAFVAMYVIALLAISAVGSAYFSSMPQ